MIEERDPATSSAEVSRRYRELSAEEPPRELDDAILAAARRSAQPWTKKWAVPLSLAAVVVLSVTVTLQIQHEQPGIESPVPRAAAPSRAVETVTEAAKEAVIASRKKDRPAPTAPAPAVSSAPQPKPFVADETATPAHALGEVTRSEAAGASGALAGRAEERSSRNDQAELAPQLKSSRAMAKREGSAELQAVPRQVETPERELERIAELRAQGRHDEADRELAEFRKRYPDYKIPQAMRERIERRR